MNLGKSATHVWEVANELKKLGIEVHMILPQLCESTDPTYGLNIHIVKNLINIGNRIQFALLSIYYIIRLDNLTRLDIIYTRSLINFLPLCFLNIILKKKLVLEANCIWSDEQTIEDNGLKKFFKIYFIKSMELFAAKHAKCILTVTRGIKEHFIENGIDARKIFIVENGANTELFKPMNLQQAQRLVGLNPKNKYVCFVGSLAPWQGVEYLIEAAPYVVKRLPEVRFMIIGDGAMRKRLEEIAEQLDVNDKFIFKGHVSYEKVPNFINACLACIACKKPIKSGYSPLKLYEYLACGRPIIASKVKGFEFLEEINCGILVDPACKEELANAILRLISDEKLNKTMGEIGRRYVVENHSWTSVAENIIEICSTALNKR